MVIRSSDVPERAARRAANPLAVRLFTVPSVQRSAAAVSAIDSCE